MGASSNYFEDLFADRRKKEKLESDLNNKFNKCKQVMPELIKEMSEDLRVNSLKRFFYIIDMQFESCLGKKELDLSFVYYTYGGNGEVPLIEKAIVHDDLHNKIVILEQNGFIEDLVEKTEDSWKKIPKYKMNEEFVDLLIKEK